MASKMVTDRQKSAEAVLAIGAAQGASLRELPQLTTAGPDGSKLDVDVLIHRLSSALSGARDRMVAADEAHENELADDPAAREARDAAAAAVSDQLVGLRDVLSGVYGAAAAAKVMPKRTPRDPVMLARFAGEVVTQLRGIDLPAPRMNGLDFKTEQLADSLEVGRAELEERLAHVAREEREHDATLIQKNQAIADYDRTFQGVANVLTGLFTLAGQDELADRVRPSSRRPGRTASEEATDAPPEG